MDPAQPGHPRMTPNPQSAVFCSTVRGWGWGAPDCVWPKAAAVLLQKQIPVTLVVHPDCLERDEIRALRDAGAVIFVQPRRKAAGGHWSGLRHRLIRPRSESRLATHLHQLPAPHFFFNQGGAYDLLDEDFFLPWTESPGAGYDIFVHLNQPMPPFDTATREKAKSLFLRAERCLFNSPWTRRITETQLLQDLPNARLFSYMLARSVAEPQPWPDDGDGVARLASISRLDAHHKGLDVLLLGLARMPANGPRWHFDIYGYGPDGPYLGEMIRWLGLESRVSLHSFVKDVSTVWKDHHMLVLTSRYEGLAVSMLEAMSCGRPVLRTPYGGSEWVEDGRTGFLCPSAEPDTIAASLTRALESRDQWPRMGKAARENVLSRHPADPWSVYLEPFAHLNP